MHTGWNGKAARLRADVSLQFWLFRGVCFAKVFLGNDKEASLEKNKAIMLFYWTKFDRKSASEITSESD